MIQSVLKSAALLAVATLALSLPMAAQVGVERATPQDASLLLASNYKPLRDAASAPKQLQRVVSIHLTGATLSDALGAVARAAGIRILLGEDAFAYDKPVSINVDRVAAASVLFDVLRGTNFEALVSATGESAIVRKAAGTPRATGQLVGRVTTGDGGGPVAGAEVFLEGTRWRTTTDTGGRYRLAEVVVGPYTLAVRRLGFGKQARQVTVRDGRADTVDIVMTPVATRLNELVSTATGRRRRMDIANDITTINADSVVRTQPITSLTDLLETRVPGLTVQRTSGAPGDPARLRLRGAGSPLHNNDPIVIVDGIRVYAEQSAGRSANLASMTAPGDTNNTVNYAAPSPLDYIDPNTIETVEVIKGPSAATLYGPDAANGVIVITTKKGKAGPTRWTFAADHGTSRAPGQFPELWVRWGHVPFQPDAMVVCGTGNTVNAAGAAACIADSTVSYQLLNDPTLTVLDHGNRNALTLGASGGTQTLTYSVTGSFQREVGLFKLPGYEADRYSAAHGNLAPPDWMARPQHLTQAAVMSNITARLGTTADVTLSSKLSHMSQQRSSLERQMGTLLTTFFDRSSDSYYSARNGGAISLLDNSDFLSDYYQRATATALQFTNGLNLSWRPRPWLTVGGDAGLDAIQRDDEVFLPRGFSIGTPDTSGRLATGHGSSLESTINMRGVATVPVGLGLKLNLAAGANYRGQSISDFSINTLGLPVGTTLIGDTVLSKLRRVNSDATFGWYVEQSITHSKFSLSTGLRLDGGSHYGSRVSTSGGGLSGGLPKIGFAYLISDEPFFPFKDLFQSFRLRTSYGRASRQPGITDRLRLYSAATTATVGGQSVGVAELATLGNTELRPERSSELEGGFDTDLLNSRISLSLTLYRKTTDDFLLPVPLAPSVYGGDVGSQVLITKNIGVVRNTGLELTASTQLVRSAPVTWGANLLLSRNRSVVVKLAPGVEPFYLGADARYGGNRVAPGYPLFGRWASPILGYTDANGNGALESSEVVVGDTAVYVGSSVPNYQVDVRTDLSFWRGALTLSAGLHYDDGLTQFNELAQSLAPFAAARNSESATLADQVAVIDLGQQMTYNWYQKVRVVRLQNVSLGYRVPQAMARRFGAQTLSVMLQGTNLGLWTNYLRGRDPNVNAFGNGNAGTADNGVLPQPRSWQLRISAGY